MEPYLDKIGVDLRVRIHIALCLEYVAKNRHNPLGLTWIGWYVEYKKHTATYLLVLYLGRQENRKSEPLSHSFVGCSRSELQLVADGGAADQGLNYPSLFQGCPLLVPVTSNLQ